MSTYTGQGSGALSTEKRTTMAAHMQSEVKWKLEGSNASVSGVRREVRSRAGRRVPLGNWVRRRHGTSSSTTVDLRDQSARGDK